MRDLESSGLDGNFLEIGAGPGLLAILIAELNPYVNITTTDISPDMVTVASERVGARHLNDRIHCLVADANDEGALARMGEYDLVYSTFSLHHWRDPVKSIGNLWNMVKDGGLLYIYDFKRVPWLCGLPIKSGDIDSIRAPYTPSEIRCILNTLSITHYDVRTRFPFCLQSIAASKSQK